VVGGPSGIYYDDWLIEGDYLTSSATGPIIIRFVASVTDVSKMHTMFCEGVALRIGLEVAPTITQSGGKAKEIAGKYQKWESQAATVDGVESGYEDPPDDDYVSVRL